MREGVELKNLTTFKCGGPARYYDEPASAEETAADLKFAAENGLDVFVLGGGANCLISDKGFDGLVIKIGKGMASYELTENADGTATVRAGAGLPLIAFATRTAQAGYTGTEFATGIPGTLGGGVFMNAGAYGGEMRDIITSVTYIDAKGEIREVSGDDLDFGYRRSFFAKLAVEGKTFVILSVTALVHKGDPAEITARIEEYRGKRTSSQPLDMPSAGSTFKRPEGYFAGKLIDDAGLRGFALEGSAARVSPKHCGFIVNEGGKASAQDVYDLIVKVSDTVFEKSGVRLEPEVRLVGAFEGRLPVINICSFGFKYGVPEGSNLVFDVRSLKNPYWEPELKFLSGLDEPVRDYLAGFEKTGILIANDVDEIEDLHDEFRKAGKDELYVAVGCTGGHHRSVYCATRIASELRARGYQVTLTHKDIIKDACDE
ncbi:UDP-N-acetylmuramate dehydrogenase [Ruminococcaceae bacterium YRB3002]|nr:UDP-N-acetylmuramate dehydrogenase [Ruminococcaceae bacterium YRB3002]